MGFLGKLETIPSQYRWAMIPGLLLVMAMAYWYGLHRPQAEQIAALEEQSQRQSVTLNKYRQTAAHYAAFQADVEALEVGLRQALTKLPDSKEIPDLIRQISDLGVRTGLQITLLRPQAEQIQEFYAAVPITVKMVGAFHSVGQFFDELARLPRIVSVGKVKLDTSTNKEVVSVNTECLATTYRFLDDSEVRASAAQDKRRNKNGRKR